MKRGTPNERRWENGLRQAAPTSNVSEPMKSPVRGSTKVRKPQTETRTRSENRITPTPLAATAALQAYLSNDVDARSRIPGPGGKEAGRSTAEPTTKRTEAKRHEHEKPIVPIYTATSTTSARGGDAAPQPESPLSRFQTHMKQSGTNREKTRCSLATSHRVQSPHNIAPSRRDAPRHPITTGPSETLTRSLIDKIQEAKRLRHTETEHDQRTKKRHDREIQSPVVFTLPARRHVSPAAQAQPTSASLTIHMTPSPTKTWQGASPSPSPPPKPIVVSTSSPPVPHAKPVMPAIPISPSTPPAVKLPEEGQQEGNLKGEPASDTMPSSVNTVIEVTNAVLLIQRTWRRRRLIVRCRRRNQQHGGEFNRQEPRVTLVVDKPEAVAPLFSKMNMKSPEVIPPPLQETRGDEGGAPATHEQNSDEIVSSHTSHPWTDNELVFLEEGRHIGDLQDSVRKGFSVDEDELIWKCPQQIIHRIEADRVTTLRNTRRKRPTIRQLECPAPPEVNGPDTDVSETISPTVNSPHSVLLRSRAKDAATTARRRKMARVLLWKRRSRSIAAMICPARKASKTRGLFVRARTKCYGRSHVIAAPSSSTTEAKVESPAEIQDDQAGNQSDCVVRSPRQAGSASRAMGGREQPAEHNLAESEAHSSSALLHQFVVFSGSGEAFSPEDTAISRNDLISVGDLALARSLLYDRHHGQTANNLGGYSEGFIPLTLPATSPQTAEPSARSVEAWDEPSTEHLTPVATGFSEEYQSDNQEAGLNHNAAAVDNETKNRDQDNGGQPFDQFSEEPEGIPVVHYRESLWKWQGHCDDGVSLASSASSSPSSTSSACSEILEDQAADDTGFRQSSPADPMRALQVVKSAVTETMARIQDEQQAACQQQLEAPSSPPSAPAPKAASIQTPRLDEAKRLEFLRALEDFKRCLRPTSSPSSVLSDA